MKKIKEEVKNLIDDLKNRRFTDRVKVFTAILSSLVIVVSFVVLSVNASNNKAPDSVSETASDVKEQDDDSIDEKTLEEDKSEDSVKEKVEDEIVEPDAKLAETEDAGNEYIENTLFLGDSNTVRMMSYGITSLENTFAVVGMGIQSVKTLKCVQFEGYNEPCTMVEGVKLLKPSRIIITFGTNNANGMSSSDFIKQYKGAINAIREAAPGVDILINSIPPIAKENRYPSLSQNSIDNFNNALIVMAKEMDCKYIDSASVMKDEKTGYAKEGYTVGDGIHISEDGFAAMFTYIRTHSHVVKDTTPKPVTPLPKQVQATYVVDSNGKMNDNPDIYKEYSEVSKQQQEALKKALEESAKKAKEELMAKAEAEKKNCDHSNYDTSVEREATTENTGLVRYTCRDCGYVYEETTPKKEDTKEDEKRKEEEEKKRAEEEARKALEEEKKAEEEAKKRAEEEARKRAEEEEARRAEEEARKRAEEEEAKRAEEEARKRAEEEARKAQEEATTNSQSQENESSSEQNSTEETQSEESSDSSSDSGTSDADSNDASDSESSE